MFYQSEEDYIRLSKTIAYALRHNPDAFSLSLSSDGSVLVSDLIDAINRKKGINITLDDIHAVLSLPGKKRYSLEHGRIRAYYGHSVKKEIEVSEIIPPSVLYHGTTHDALSSIKEKGLLPMNRQHVHLSAQKETALNVGRRRDKNPILLEIDASRAYKDGVKFYKGNEDIILSDPIAPKYFKILF